MLRPIFFDTETTGVRSESDRIVELAAYDLHNKRSFVQLINPKMRIPKDATSVHGISDEMVQDAPHFPQVAKEFISFCEGEVALIGHNCDSFDIPFLRAEFSRNGLVIPAHWIFIDSLKWARRYRRDLPKHALQFLRQVYDIEQNQAHRALDDVMVLAEVFQLMTDDLSCEEIISLLGSKTQALAAIPKKPQETLSLFS